MRTNTLFLIAGILALLFGLGFLLVPATMLPVYGVAAEPAVVLMSRFFGVAMVHLGVTLYLLRDVREPATQYTLSLAGVIGSALGVVVALMAVLGHLVNAVGWSTVVIYALLLLGYVSCLRTRPALA
jgi:uncharacterized membrane protein YfcA